MIFTSTPRAYKLEAKESIVMQKWILYQIASERFYEHVKKYQKGASHPAISDAEGKGLKIPLPPLPEQRGIVRISDNSTLLLSVDQPES